MLNTPETPNQSLIAACIANAPAQSSARDSLRAGGLFSEGRRDNDFTSTAGFWRSRGASEEEITTLLQGVDSVIPKPHGIDNINRISRSVARYEVKPDFFTHDSFAKLLARELASDVCYCEGQGFYIYEDGYWQRDMEELWIMHKVRLILDKIRADIELLNARMDSEKWKKLKKAAKKLEAAGFMRESLKLLKSDPAIRVSFSTFDAKRHLINMANGTFNLDTMVLQPFDAKDYLTVKLDTEYDAQAACPLFRKFISEILSPEVGSFMMRLLGYALEGHGREQSYFICHGSGKNGKSTLMETMTEIFGSHLITLQPETLNGKKDGQIRNDLARLVGKRVMLTSETRHGTVLDAPLLKQITGQDVLTARLLFKEYFEFRPCCVPFIVTNYMPIMDGGDVAMNRRLHIIGFDHVVNVIDRELPIKLLAEKAGIFNWILEGLRDYRINGLAVPDSIKERTAEFMKVSNLIQGFVDDRIICEQGAKLYASQLYRAYESWCREGGYRPMSMNQLKESLERCLGCKQERSNQGLYWPNWRLKFGL